jgi:hypothetical protein
MARVPRKSLQFFMPAPSLAPKSSPTVRKDDCCIPAQPRDTPWSAPIEWSNMNVSAWSASGLSGRCFRARAGGIPGRCAV